MKNKKVWIFAVLVFVICLVGTFIGFFSGNALVETICSVVAIASIIIFSIVTSILNFKDVKKIVKDAKSSGELTSETNKQAIEDINNSFGYDNQINQAKYSMQQTKNAFENSTTGEKVAGILFLIVFFVVFIGIIVCSVFNLTTYCLIGVGIIFALVICALIVVKLKEKRSLSLDEADYLDTSIGGEVVSCSVSSQTARGRNYYTERITDTTYKVRVRVGEKIIIAYSKKFYDKGTQIRLYQHKKYKNTYIIREDEDLSDF